MFGITLLTKEEKAERDKNIRIESLKVELILESDKRTKSLERSQLLREELESLLK